MSKRSMSPSELEQRSELQRAHEDAQIRRTITLYRL